MRRKDREITDIDQIFDILQRCDTIRLGIYGNEYPYVVPLSFGCEMKDGTITVYFHGAKEGLKHELLAANPNVCVEADIFKGYVGTGNGTTTDYESVIGFGRAEICEDEEAVHGIELLTEHCGIHGFDGKTCIMLGITRINKVTITEITGKKRF